MVNQFRRDFGDIIIDLDQAAGQDFVEAFLDSEPNQLGARFRATLYRQTDGHALFTTELLRAMQERGDLRQDETGAWVEGSTLDWDTLPARVEGVVGERLGRLSEPLRELLRVACVEGETFTAEVVAHVLGLTQSKLGRQLRQELAERHRLVQADRLIRLDNCHLTRYRFRHVLTRKYLYSHLPEAERALLHEAVGQALEALYGAQAEEVAVQLAWHFQAAGLVSRAITYLYQAGTRAARLAANAETVVYLTWGLFLLKTGPDSSERALRKPDFLTALGPILLTVKSSLLQNRTG